MFFLDKLTPLGKWIYFLTVIVAVVVLVVLNVNTPKGQRAFQFCVFAAIWFLGTFVATRFKKK